jgi:enoyl-CoA hydratase/carnithine racemase
MSEPAVRLEIGPVSRIVLNRPEKQNAMTVEMGDLVAEAVERINASAEPRLVLVTGAGRAFCAGGDFDVIEANSRRAPEPNRIGMLGFYRRFLSVLTLRVPSVAVLHGATVGAGLCLAMACDLRLAAREAKLGANFVRVGLHPGMACSLLLPRLVGPAKAAELIFTGRLVLGDEAERIGLVNAAVPREELPSLVERTVAEITSSAPVAVAQAKATLLAPLIRELDDTLHREANAQAIDFGTADLGEAVAAFRAGRKPEFSGS